MSFEHEHTFHSMGSDVRLLIGRPLLDGDPPPEAAAERERAYIEDFAARLSRFRADSELSALNRRPPRRGARLAAAARGRARRPVGGRAQRRPGRPDARRARSAGRLRSAPTTGEPGLARARRCAPRPPRRPARAEPGAPLAADRRSTTAPASSAARPAWSSTRAASARACAPTPSRTACAGYTRFVVDCGGDIAIGGIGAQLEPYEVEVEHPLTGETIRSVRVGTRRGRHLGSQRPRLARRGTEGTRTTCSTPPPAARLDRADRRHRARPERARGRDAVQDGPAARAGGRQRVLAAHGGLIVHDDGDVEVIGPLDGPPRRSSRVAARGALHERRHGPDPPTSGGWSAAPPGSSRSGLITLAVLLGLTMAAKLLRRPGLGRDARAAPRARRARGAGRDRRPRRCPCSATSGCTPGSAGLTVPFTMGYRPLFTGLGIIAGYLAALLGLSFYVRRRIGVKPVAAGCTARRCSSGCSGVVHTLGAGTDAATVWLRAFVLAPAIPIVYLLVARFWPQAVARRRRGCARRRPRRSPPRAPPAAADTQRAERRAAAARALAEESSS